MFCVAHREPAPSAGTRLPLGLEHDLADDATLLGVAQRRAGGA
jgi:hypothetical protein